MATKLVRSIAVTEKAYARLVDAARAANLPIGEVASVAIDQFLNTRLEKISARSREILRE